MHLAASLLTLAASAGVAGQALYEFGPDKPLVKLDDSNFETLVVKDDTALWVVEYYADWCGHCKQFAKGYEKAAANLQGIVKFGAVNAENAKKTAAAASVQGYPTVKLFAPGTGGRNPYTGKMFKPAIDYNGPRSARGVVDFATAQLPSLVVPVDDGTFDAFASNGSLPKAILFTKKSETTPLFKSLSLSLKGRMLVGEAHESDTKAASTLGVSSYPSLIVLPADKSVQTITYDGEMKPAALRSFLDSHAAPVPEASGAKDSSSSSAKPTADDLSVAIDENNVASLVEGERDAWILVFAGSEGAELDSPGGTSALSEALYGQVKVGKGTAEVAKQLGISVGKKPVVVVYPYRKVGVKRKVSKDFGPSAEGVASAKKEALESLPDSAVEKLNSMNVDKFMQEGMMTTSAGAFALLFSDKTSVPPLFRAISLAFEGKLAFGIFPANDPAATQRFQVTKAPTLVVMFPDENQKDEKGNVPLAGMQFQPQMHGKFNFGNIANFLAQVVAMREEKTGRGPAPGGGDQADESQSGGRRREGGGGSGSSGGSVRGPLPELGAANFEAECVAKGGLCAIALLDGAPENTNREAQIEMLTKLRKRKAGGPLSFSWIDATCHSNFAGSFGLSEMDLPTMVFLSPTKLRWARAVGAFDAETLGAFGSMVASGKKATETISELPVLEEVDCATVKRGAAAYEEEEGADDIMAEILEEERKAREAREAELAAEGVAAPTDAGSNEPKKSKESMTKLERLESEVEECEAMDLLCTARREKQLKAYEKERALQAKLAEIARKKKKAKKKAKKAKSA